ncbi:hypothetical protein P7D86_21205 [Enterococcus avium]|uniref:hypothetical protein n=1 Tax=Enterococcus avium TaxID=33945 RepID=UPI002891D65B|nr:hypothetical protein [Enterococcus avium]MDT2429335.1 hypothetical protein [Enterococcus avium]
MSQTIYGFCNEYIEIEKSDDHVILDLGYYDSEDEVSTQAERVSFSKQQVRKIIIALEKSIKGEDKMAKTIEGGIQLIKEGNQWGTEITKNLKEDKELRLVFTSMIVETLAQEMGVPVRDMADMLVANAEKNPLDFSK